MSDFRCVVTTVRRMVCYDEKSSKPRAKACAHAARGTGSKNHGSSALADAMLYCTQLSFFSLVITCGLWPRLQPCVGLCSPGSRCVKHWWKGAATLQIRALHAIGTASEPPASQSFKPAPYSPPVHVLTVCSAPVNHVQSESICGPIISMILGLQRLSSMPSHGLGMA